MSQVFLSYRQTDDEQRQRVRAFAEHLRKCDIDVILDQFFLDDNPGGPDEGWDKWSSDRALKTDCVIIIGTREWFEAFEKTQPPGTALGVATEADDIRWRIYKAAGVIKNIRVVLFDDTDAAHIPDKLSRYQRFHAERDFENIVRCSAVRLLLLALRTLRFRTIFLRSSLSLDARRSCAKSLMPRPGESHLGAHSSMAQVEWAKRLSPSAPLTMHLLKPLRIAFVSLRSRT